MLVLTRETKQIKVVFLLEKSVVDEKPYQKYCITLNIRET